MEMLANQKREPTTSGGPEDNSPEHSAGSSDSIRHTSECAIAFGIRGCRRSSDDRQVGGLGETTSYRSGRVAFFHDIFVPSFFPPVCLEENDAEYLGGMGEKGCGSIKTGSRRCLKTVRWVRLPAVGGSRLHRWWQGHAIRLPTGLVLDPRKVAVNLVRLENRVCRSKISYSTLCAKTLEGF